MGIGLTKFLNTSQHFSTGYFTLGGFGSPAFGTRYNTISNGPGAWDSIEANFQTPAPFAFTLTNLIVKATGNPADTGQLNFRLNGATAATLNFTITASPEFFNSGPLNVPVQAADLINYQSVGGGASIAWVYASYLVGLN